MKLFKSLVILSVLATINFINANDIENLKNSVTSTIAILEKKEISNLDIANFMSNFKKANDLFNNIQNYASKAATLPALQSIREYIGFVSPLYDALATQALNPLLYFKQWREQNNDELNNYITNFKTYMNYLAQ